MRNAAVITIGLLLACSLPASAHPNKFQPGGKFGGPASHTNYLPTMPPQSMPAAGGQHAEIIVTNESDGQIVVLLDATSEDLATLSDPTTATVANLHAHHGRLLNARASTTFTPVTINTGHTVHVAFTAAAQSPGSGTGDTNTFSFTSANSGRMQVRTGGHQSLNVVRVTGNPGAPPQVANVNLTLRREIAFGSFGLCGIMAVGLVGYRFGRKRPV